jgi:hypothetical protein
VDSSFTQGFMGPTVFARHLGCHDHDGRVVLIGQRGHGALIQEGPPLIFLLGVLPIWHCSLVYVASASPVSVLTLKGGVGVTGVAPLRSWSFIGLRRARRPSRIHPWWHHWL